MQHLTRNGSLGFSLILLLSLLTALDAMAIDMYLPGMPNMAADFNVSPGRIQQTLSIFLAGLAIGQSIYGPLLDRFGRRTPLLIGIAIFTAGSVLGALAPSVEWLLVARFIQAIGASAGLVTPRAITADLCNMAESARIFSLLMQIMMIAPILAPIIGGYLLGHGGWPLIFWLLAILGVIGFIWSLRTIPDSLPIERRTPLRLGHIVYAYGLQLRNRVFMAYALSGGFTLASLFVYISGSAFVFTEYFKLTPAQFSYLFAANSIGLVLGGMLSNRLLRLGQSSQRIMIIGLVAHAAAGLALYLTVQMGFTSFIIYACILAFSISALGLVFGNVTALTMNNAGPQIGIASALMGVLQYMIASIVGYIVSLTAQGLGQLPISIGICGLLALLSYYIAARTSGDSNTNELES